MAYLQCELLHASFAIRPEQMSFHKTGTCMACRQCVVAHEPQDEFSAQMSYRKSDMHVAGRRYEFSHAEIAHD